MKMREYPRHHPGPPDRRGNHKSSRQPRRHHNLRQIEAAARHAAHHRQHDQSKHVINHRRRQNDLARAMVQKILALQHRCRNPHARGHQRCPHEKRRVRRSAPRHQNSPSRQERRHLAQSGNQRGEQPYPQQIRQLHFEPNAEEQEQHAEVRERPHRFVGRYPIEHARPDQDSRQDFAGDSRQTHALEKFGDELGRAEHNQHRQRKRKLHCAPLFRECRSPPLLVVHRYVE